MSLMQMNRFGLYVNLEVSLWDDSRVAFTVLSQPPSVRCLPDDLQDVPSLREYAQISLIIKLN